MHYNSGRQMDSMPSPKPKRSSADVTVAPSSHGDPAFAAAVGSLLSSCRARRGMTRQQLAQRSGTSERYLAQIEGGQGNPSVIVLKSIADALDVPIAELVPRNGVHTAALDRIVNLLTRISPSDLPALTESIEKLAAAHLHSD